MALVAHNIKHPDDRATASDIAAETGLTFAEVSRAYDVLVDHGLVAYGPTTRPGVIAWASAA
jgi:DNA-binding IclR family transcriptional regulator